ncbi:MAG: YggT family protein, partial [Chloroflexota bacterium]|nr:YggT family protein [Chloroflexota bacterium]
MQAIGGLLVSLLYLFVFVIFIRSILSWFPMSPYNPIKSALDQITEPVLGPLRRYLPTFGMLDLSPMIAIILIIFLIIPLVSALFGLT